MPSPAEWLLRRPGVVRPRLSRRPRASRTLAENTPRSSRILRVDDGCRRGRRRAGFPEPSDSRAAAALVVSRGQGDGPAAPGQDTTPAVVHREVSRAGVRARFAAISGAPTFRKRARRTVLPPYSGGSLRELRTIRARDR